jgi:hypothetical protein
VLRGAHSSYQPVIVILNNGVARSGITLSTVIFIEGVKIRCDDNLLISVPQRLKPLFSSDCCGTAEAVPLSKTVRALLEYPPLRDETAQRWGTQICGWARCGHPPNQISELGHPSRVLVRGEGCVLRGWRIWGLGLSSEDGSRLARMHTS